MLGAKWIRQHRRLCLSSLRRNLLLKVNKKVSYTEQEVVTCFRIPRFLCSLYVLSLWTLYVHFAHSINCEYGTINDAGRLLYKNIYLSFICKGTKGLLRVCVWEGAGDRTWLQYFDPIVKTVNVVSFSFFDVQPEALGSILLGDGFLYCILSASSQDPKLHQGSQGPLRLGVAFLTTSRLSPSDLQLDWLSNSTELYNRSTPTRPLKSNV